MFQGRFMKTINNIICNVKVTKINCKYFAGSILLYFRMTFHLIGITTHPKPNNIIADNTLIKYQAY